MKKVYSLLSLLLCASLATNAQVIQAVSMSPSESATTTSAAVGEFTVDKARKATFEYMKTSLTPFENDKIRILPKGLDSVFTSQKSLSKESFASAMNEFEKLTKAEAKLLGTNSFDNVAKMAQTSKLRETFSIGKSAECFETTETGNFVRVSTIEGPQLVGFELAPLKQNPRYGLVEDYSQGFARVRKDMVFGFMDLCGKTVIQPQYDQAERFNDGKALVKKYFWHFIGTDGKESEVLEGIIEGKAVKYGISIAKFANQKVAFIDNDFDKSKKPISMYFDEIENFIGDLFRVRIDKRYGLIKIDGSAVTDVTYERIYLSEANKWIIIEQDKKVGLIDVDGNTRIKPSYESIISVNVDPAISKASSIIAKDAAGYRIIELKDRKLSDVYASIGLFNSFGLARACKSPTPTTTRCGYIDYEGKEIIPSNFDKVSDFAVSGFVVVTEQNTNCSMPVGNCQTDMVYDRFGRLVIGKTKPDSPIGTIYAITDTLIAQTLVAVKTLTANADGKFEEGYNLVNKYSYTRFTKEAYQLIKRFDKNYFAIRKNNVWGLIDNFGNEVLAPTYMDLVHSSDGLFGVMYDNEKYGYIDETGKIRITFEYTEINPFSNGLAIVSQGKSRYGIINKFNAKIAPCMFKTITTQDGKYTLLDKNNTYVLNSEGDCVSDNCKEFYDIVRKANQK